MTDETGVPANTPTQTLAGRVALVTGGSGGIGSALVRRLAHAGVDVALTYSGHPEDAEKLVYEVRSAGRRAVAVQADLADPAAPLRVVRVAEEQLRAGLDILVAAAGVASVKSWKELDLDLWERTQAVNVRAPFFLTQLPPLPIPVGRLGTTEEVADLALAMLRNGYLTDKVISLDGGLYPD